MIEYREIHNGESAVLSGNPVDLAIVFALYAESVWQDKKPLDVMSLGISQIKQYGRLVLSIEGGACHDSFAYATESAMGFGIEIVEQR